MVISVTKNTGEFAGHVSDVREPAIEYELETGSQTFSFKTGLSTDIKNEYTVETQDDAFVVKEVTTSLDGKDVYCVQDLRAFESTFWTEIEIKSSFDDEEGPIKFVETIAGRHGWTAVSGYGAANSSRSGSNLVMRPKVKAYNVTDLDVLYKLRDAYMCEISFNAKEKQITVAPKIGSYKGVYLMPGVNMTDVQKSVDSSELYTGIYPVGAEGITVESVNPTGKKVIKNMQYQTVERVLYWDDSTYETETDLFVAATMKLNDISKPRISYSCRVIDLARMNLDKYLFAFDIGDTVDIYDTDLGISDQQRVVKMTIYPDNPEDNSVELSNTTLTFEDMIAKAQASINAWDDSKNADGTIKGTRVQGVQIGDVVGVKTYVYNEIENNATVASILQRLQALESK